MPDSSNSTRRQFLATSAYLVAGSLTPAFSRSSLVGEKRKFKMCLNPGSIGVSFDQEELLDTAILLGYEAIISMPEQLVEFSEERILAIRRKMKKNRISWGSTNLPVEFRKDEATFKSGVARLPTLAKALHQAGATRMNTWILNGNAELTYLKNFQQHANRLRECAEILKAYNIRLGLEYVAPKTLMNRYKYPFMRTMAETRELIATIGEPNVGLVLDSFHWYCAEDTLSSILDLKREDIVTCDLNDARSDLSRDEQIDGTRELPLATGVIDLKYFLQALVDIGYDGPVRSEPFNQELNEMEDEKALKLNYETMRKAFALVE